MDHKSGALGKVLACSYEHTNLKKIVTVECQIPELELVIRHWNKQGYSWRETEIIPGGYRITFKESLKAELERLL